MPPAFWRCRSLDTAGLATGGTGILPVSRRPCPTAVEAAENTGRIRTYTVNLLVPGTPSAPWHSYSPPDSRPRSPFKGFRPARPWTLRATIQTQVNCAFLPHGAMGICSTPRCPGSLRTRKSRPNRRAVYRRNAASCMELGRGQETNPAFAHSHPVEAQAFGPARREFSRWCTDVHRRKQATFDFGLRASGFASRSDAVRVAGEFIPRSAVPQTPCVA